MSELYALILAARKSKDDPANAFGFFMVAIIFITGVYGYRRWCQPRINEVTDKLKAKLPQPTASTNNLSSTNLRLSSGYDIF